MSLKVQCWTGICFCVCKGTNKWEYRRCENNHGQNIMPTQSVQFQLGCQCNFLQHKPIVNHCLSGSKLGAITVTVEWDLRKAHSFSIGIDQDHPVRRNGALQGFVHSLAGWGIRLRTEKTKVAGPWCYCSRERHFKIFRKPSQFKRTSSGNLALLRIMTKISILIGLYWLVPMMLI